MNGSFVCLTVSEGSFFTSLFIFLNVKELRFGGKKGTSSFMYQL